MKKTLLALALAAGLTSFAGSAKAAITYNLNNYTAGQSGWLINGTITVSELGVLTQNKIVSWEFTTTKGASSFGGSGFSYSTGMSSDANAPTLLATSTALFLPNTTALSLYGSTGQLYWRDNLYGASDYYGVDYSQGLVFRSSTYSPVSGSSWQIGTAVTAAVPEPSQVAASILLIGGIAGFVIVRRRKETTLAQAA